MSERYDLSSNAPTTNLRPAAEDYLGRPVPVTEDIALTLRDVLVVARQERATLEAVRAEANLALGRPTFRVLDRIILILRGQPLPDPKDTP